MFRLTPNNFNSSPESYFNNYTSSYGGCEANSLAFLANKGHRCEFLSSFPNNDLGYTANKYLKSHGIECNSNFDENRMGIYFTEPGKNNNLSKIIYDRKNSSFSKFKLSNDIIENTLKNTSYLIISGITPALSLICYKNIFKIVKEAKKNNIKIIYDINFRKSLWTKVDCKKFNLKILKYVDFLFTNSKTANYVLDLPSKMKKGNFFYETENSIELLQKKFKIPFIGMTVRNENKLGGIIFINNKIFHSNIYRVNQVDRVGAGDAFLGATLNAFIKKYDGNEMINYATSFFALSHTVHGDVNNFTNKEIINFSNLNTTSAKGK